MPSAPCQVLGKYWLENERTSSRSTAATNTAVTLAYPLRIARNTNSPDVVQNAKSGSMWPSESAASATPMPPSRPEMMKFVPLTQRTEAPRYSTRISLSRAASDSSPRIESK